MENIGLCKRDMAVLPQREALAASPFASLAFAQAILERNNTATGLYTPLHLIYAPEEAQAEAPAPKVEVDLHLTLPAEKQSKAKQEAPGERVVESMTERMVERILRERFTMERSVIRQAAPTIQNFYHTSVRAALARREVFLQGPVAQAQAMATGAAARQKAPEPVQLRYAQVLRRNQEAGLTASTRAPLERQAFPPAQTAAPKAPAAPAGDAQAVPAAPAGDAQAVPAQAARAQTPQGQGSQTPIVPAQAAQTSRGGASQARLEQGEGDQSMVASPAVQPEPGMAPLDLQQATLPSQPIAREAIPAAQPVQTQGQSAPSPQADAQAEALAQAIQGQPSSSLTSPATMTYRQAAQEEGSRTGARQAKKARPPQAAGQPPMDVPPQEKAGAAQRAQGASQARPKATAAEEKQAREQQPPAGQDKDIASHFAPAQPAAEGEGLQPERADDQPVMAQRALGQEAAPGPVGAALQYAPIPEPGQAPEPGPSLRQRAAREPERPPAKAGEVQGTAEARTVKEEARQTAKSEAQRLIQGEAKQAVQEAVAAERSATQASPAPPEAAQPQAQPAPMAQAPAQPVAATGGMQTGTPLVYGPTPQGGAEEAMQLPWHRDFQPLGQRTAQALPQQMPAAGGQGMERVFRPLGSVKSPGYMTGFRPGQTQAATLPAAGGSGQFQRQPLAYAASRPQAQPAMGSAPKGGEKAAPAQAGYSESPYVQSLPGWARDFLRDSFEPTKQKQPAQPMPGSPAAQGQPGASPAGPSAQPASQMVWTAPGYTGATARMTHKKKPETQETPPLRFSDAEIKRMASQVYTIIQDRLKRDQRRLGL
ncbi:MAG TPA: hypothetical protein IAC97_03395 [Candidatus Pelethousia gallinarum]|nr:hypothetical protein [Candidatus Pelethousia gallinarum]